jgi:PAS domain S-box-containing protein
VSHPEGKCPFGTAGSGWLPASLQSQENSAGLAAALFEGNPDMVLVVDADGRISGANNRALEGFRYSRQELEGQPVEILLPMEVRGRHAGLVRDFMKHPKLRPMGSCMNLMASDSSGRSFPVDVLLRPVETAGGTCILAVCHRLDTTMARAQMRIHALVDNHRDHAINLLDAEGRILTWNEGARRIYNLSGSEALGRYYSILFTPQQIEAGEPEKHMEGASRSGESARTTAWRTSGDGGPIWTETFLTCTRDPSSEVLGYTVVLRDLTSFKRAEEALLASNHALMESEQRFRLLVESVSDYAIYMIDPEGLVVTWNVGAERSKGYKPEEVLGRSFSMFFLPGDVEAGVPEKELAAARENGRYQTESWRLRKNGAKFWAFVTMTAIYGLEGELRGFAKITRDMTVPKQLEESLAKLASDLEARVAERTSQLESTVNELRSKNMEVEALVAMVSHDLSEKEVLLREVYHRVKNNLQVVQSLLKMGARSIGTGDARPVIETAIQRVHVMAMVHQHLYQMPDLAALSLSAYLRDVVDGAIASNCETSGQVRLKFDVDEIPLSLDLAVPFGLLANELVSNCIKHGLAGGRRGKISICARSIPGAVRFSVQDDGAGLPENFDAARSSSMGLKLADNLARQLGGRLEFTSGSGCRVEADLLRLAPRPASPEAGSPRVHVDVQALLEARLHPAMAKSLPGKLADPAVRLT